VIVYYIVLKLKLILLSRDLPNMRNHGKGERRTINNCTYLLRPV
jgi:hypothetical protein